METWKEIKSINKLGRQNYEVSNLGKVRNQKTGRILKAQISKDGYVRLYINNKSVLMHRLVAECFCEKSDDTFNIVHHLDNDKQNNNSDNLEWCNQSINVRKAFEDGLIGDRSGVNNPNYKHGRYC